MKPKKIIIIGATSGIGKLMARAYLQAGNQVGITGRRQHLLEEIKKDFPARTVTAHFDVMGPDNIHHLEKLIKELNGLDLLIYNAGIGEASEKLVWDIEKVTTQTNVNGFIEIVQYAFNYFVAQDYGQIAVVSSVAALRGNSWAPAYSASKSFISIYAEGLNMKAHKLKKPIVVTNLLPGFIDTKIAKGNKRFWVAPPHKAARQIMQAIHQKKRKAYITKRWWLVAKIVKLLPFSIYRHLA